jgi:hypothetical protein
MKYKDKDLTPWFPADVKPVRPGVYRVAYAYFGDTCYAFWDGRRWGRVKTTIRKAIVEAHPSIAAQNKVWRGLNKEPV